MPSGLRRFLCNLAPFLRSERSGARFAALGSSQFTQRDCGSVLVPIIVWPILNFSRRYPHDMDGVADDIGGAFLALGLRGRCCGPFARWPRERLTSCSRSRRSGEPLPYPSTPPLHPHPVRNIVSMCPAPN